MAGSSAYLASHREAFGRGGNCRAPSDGSAGGKKMLAQQLVNGFVLGATYALFALGFTMMFGVLGVINLTYGVYFALGAFVALWASKAIGLSVWLALPFAAICAGCIAIVIDTLLLTRLRRAKAPELSSLMVTIGATLFLYTGLSVLYGTEIRRFPADFAPSA